jgi:TRAP-type C4-dicarboxylate transport system permease small subunit
VYCVEKLKLIDKYIKKVTLWITGALFIVVGLSIFLQILFRYVLSIGLNWVDEFSRYGLVWIIFLGGASAINVIEQTCITFIKNKIPHKALKWIILVFRIAIIIFLIVLIITGFQFARLGKMSKTLALWGLSQYWAFLAIPVGSVFMTISYIIKTILDFFMFEETNHKQEAVQI